MRLKKKVVKYHIPHDKSNRVITNHDLSICSPILENARYGSALTSIFSKKTSFSTNTKNRKLRNMVLSGELKERVIQELDQNKNLNHSEYFYENNVTLGPQDTNEPEMMKN